MPSDRASYRVCRVCLVSKPPLAFWSRASVMCRECRRGTRARENAVLVQRSLERLSRPRPVRVKRIPLALPEAIRAARRRAAEARRAKVYGLNPDDYAALVLRAAGHCECCGQRDTNTPRTGLVIDHDHTTVRVRGLVCLGCNLVLTSGARQHIALYLQAFEAHDAYAPICPECGADRWHDAPRHAIFSRQ